MLLDVLNSDNQMIINRDAVRIFGLSAAVYCSEIAAIYGKAKKKNKLYNDNYFMVDREYITSQTTISLEEQLSCDANLEKIGVVKRDPNNVDLLFLDVETLISIISSEDVKLLESVSEKTKSKNSKKVNSSVRQRQIQQLKEGLICKDVDIMFKLYDWIDSMTADPKRFISKPQVDAFKFCLDSYCNGNKKLALDIIQIAIVHTYIDCQWAINVYESANKPIPKYRPATPTAIHSQEQKQTTSLGKEVF